MTSPVRTRFEPSPSGSIHVGTAMTCSFNWFLARRHGGAFVLRVADTDASRVVPEGLRSVTEDLRWLGLDWDEGPEVGGPHGPYFQSERGDLYRAAADRLLASGAAYRCYCTATELEEMRARQRAAGRPPRYEGRCRALTAAERAAFEADGRTHTVRFAIPAGRTRTTDLVRGEVSFEHEQLDDFVILRADGSALYNLAVSYDDMAMEITHILRGEDIFASTPKQILVMQALGAERLPSYGHIPLIVGPDRKPLGKRHGDVAVAEFRDKGFLPEVMLNYLATLNWSLGDGSTEKLTVDELIASFDPSGVTRNPSAFDIDKLLAWNGERIRELSVAELAARIEPLMVAARVLPEQPTAEQRALLAAVVPHIQERMRRLDEAPAQLRFLFADVEPDDKAAAVLTPEIASHLEAATAIVSNVEWTVAAITDALMVWADATGLKRKAALQPVRAAVTGSLVSPPLFESIELLGRDTAVARMTRAVARARA